MFCNRADRQSMMCCRMFFSRACTVTRAFGFFPHTPPDDTMLITVVDSDVICPGALQKASGFYLPGVPETDK